MNETTRKPNVSQKGNYYLPRLGEQGELLVPPQIVVASVRSVATCTIRELLNRPTTKLVQDIQKIFKDFELDIKKNADGIVAITGTNKVRFVEWKPNLWHLLYDCKTVGEIRVGEYGCGLNEIELNLI